MTAEEMQDALNKVSWQLHEWASSLPTIEPNAMVTFRDGDKLMHIDQDCLVELWRMVKRGELVEVVRCKDCKWIDLCKSPDVYEYKGANGFCSKGAKKEVEHDD